MNVLGIQLVITLAMITLFQRLVQHMSFARWFLCNHLVRFFHPTDDELKQAAGLPTHGQAKGHKGRRERRSNHNSDAKNDTFTIPKSTDVPLECGQVQPMDMLPVRFYAEYQWLVDISLCAVFVYLLTEVYLTWFPQAARDVNLSMIWCLLVIFFCLKVMWTLTAIYFALEDHGEKILCLVFGLFFLVLSMGLLITTEDLLDLGLDDAHRNFSANAKVFLEEQGIHSSGPASVSTFKLVLAFVSALIGAFLTFPGLRLAKMHMDALRYAQGHPVKMLALYVNFMSPVLLLLLWVRPAVKEHLTTAASGRAQIMSEESFYTMRLWCLVIFTVFRFLLTIPHLQAHLNLSYSRAQNLKREAGRISNIEYKKHITQVFYYLCVVALQYLSPLILLLFCTFCMKSLGGVTWTGFLGIEYPKLASVAASVASAPSNAAGDADSATGVAAELSTSLVRLRGIFTTVWYHGVFSYFSWWILVSWSTTSFFGLLYHGYFQA